jgi:branched-chain amino acid transport system permease protein
VTDIYLITDPAIFSELLLQGLVRGSIYVLMAAGLSIIFGILGVVNFAQGEFYMAGAYTAYFVMTKLQMPVVAALAASIMCGFILGMLVERCLLRPLRRRSGRSWLLDSFVVTIGLMIVGRNLAQMIFGSSRLGVTESFPGMISIGDITISVDRIAILLFSAATMALLFLFLRLSSSGKAMRATAQNTEAAQSLGIDTDRIYTVTFGIGCALAAAAGAILISILPAFPTSGEEPLMKSFAVVILGGLGSLPGVVCAGILLGLLEAYSTFFLSSGWQNSLTACLVILVLILRPGGLFSARGVRV